MAATIDIVCHHVNHLDKTGAFVIAMPAMCNIIIITDDADVTAPTQHNNALAM